MVAPSVSKVAESEPVTQTPATAATSETTQPIVRPQYATGGPRKISKNIMEDIDAALSTAATTVASEVKELTDELVQDVYEQYKDRLRSENKSVLVSQFSVIKAEVAGPDEVRLVAPTELTEEYAKEQRNLLIDHFRKHISARIRVTTEVRRNESADLEQPPVVLSKTEVFEAMAAENPNLQKLKDSLNLQIDY